MLIKIPELSIVVLIGVSGAGKSSFARQHFKSTEILSSDFCRGLVSDDENDQSATNDAFDVLQFIASKRLAAGKLVVIDATNVQTEARKPYLQLAREYHVVPVAIVLDLPERVCHARNDQRPDRNFGPHVVRNQRQQLHKTINRLEKEGFRQVYILNSEAEVAEVEIERTRVWSNLKHEHGPFDIIGDLHGCCDELEALLQQLGYQVIETRAGDGLNSGPVYKHPENRRVVFLGDLVDRGPRILDTLRLARNMVDIGSAFCVPGNHEMKFMRKLSGKNVKLTHGLAETVAEFEALPAASRQQFAQDTIEFIDKMVSHYQLDNGKLVVAHAGMKAAFQGRASGHVREFALYGETTGETDEFGLPVRYNWAMEYRGNAMVVYGHTPVPRAEWLNNTICIDTGCVYGGKLTALRYPEKELVSVPAARVYCESIKPFLTSIDGSDLAAQHLHDDQLDIEDVIGKRIISTRLMSHITIRAENAGAALEVMSRFAANPKWLIYLPPTMSPSETSKQPDLLEHPGEAFDYYHNEGIDRVICEEKHMGSRAVVIVCREEAIVRQRFGVIDEGIGICYTRTGRRFFEDKVLEQALLMRLRELITRAGLWQQFDTDWFCFDCELLPWSAKAQALLREQYAAVGAAARAAVKPAIELLAQAAARGLDISELQQHYQQRGDLAEAFVASYRRYCWPVHSLNDFKLAPFHILASEGQVHTDRDHIWHMSEIAKLATVDTDPGEQLIKATPYQVIDLSNAESRQMGIDWWQTLTANGGEGMVVKPVEFIVKGKRGFIQPAIKCRGREYLRIIYGPEYTLPENLSRLKSRGLSTKRSLALREFALGLEALQRFVDREPLRRVHECVFGVLALESEPVDPRL